MQGNIVEELRAEYVEWANELTTEERKAIRKYSYNSIDGKQNRFFERLNAMLRGAYNKSNNAMLVRYANIISGALKKHRLSFPIVCYRGVDVDPTGDVEIGTVFSFRQFVSTSVVRRKALSKEYLLVISVPAGTCGAYIENISAFPWQREFLIDKECNYCITRRQGRTIYLEVVDYEDIDK